MKYIHEFADLFKTCVEQENERLISIFQGNGYIQSFGGLVDYYRNQNNISSDIYMAKVSQLVNDSCFRDQVVELKKNTIQREIIQQKERKNKEPNNIINLYKLANNEKLLKVIDWDWIKENFYDCLCDNFPTILSDWKIVLLDDLYTEYKRSRNDPYEYSSENPLSQFYRAKGIDLKMENNYGLFSVSDGFLLKANGLPKIYDTKNDTHIIIRFVSNDFVRYLAELKAKNDFDIAFRPDYYLIGERIKDLSLILEGVIKGSAFNTCISQLPYLSQLIDYSMPANYLIIKKEDADLTFEEMVEDFEVYEDFIVTQVVHLQYIKDKEKEYITHLDHEYVFYDTESYEKKQSCLTIKGSARKRFKTFKIDNAKIEFATDANSNILFQTLKAFFKNDVLINEYFEKLIQS